MKRYLMIVLACVLITSSARSMRAQSESESLDWLQTFISSHGGLTRDLEVWSTGVGNRDFHALIGWEAIKTVKSMSYDDTNRHFVRVTGDCFGESCEYVCKSGFYDIELHDEPTYENVARMIKALVHIAELHGAKVNQKEPF